MAMTPWIPGFCDSQALFYWFEAGLGPKILGMFFNMRLDLGQSSIGTSCQPSWMAAIATNNKMHPEGTSIGSDNCDFLKVSDFNGSL